MYRASRELFEETNKVEPYGSMYYKEQHCQAVVSV